MTRLRWWKSAGGLSAGSLPTYRAEILRRDHNGRVSVYYDGGDFSAYNCEALLDVVRAESRRPHDGIDVTTEIKGVCSDAELVALKERFEALGYGRVLLRISSPGRSPLIAGLSGADRAELPSAATGTPKPA